MSNKNGNEIVINKKGNIVKEITINGIEMIGVKRCIVVADMNPNKLNEEIHITLGRWENGVKRYSNM